MLRKILIGIAAAVVVAVLSLYALCIWIFGRRQPALVATRKDGEVIDLLEARAMRLS